MFLLDTNVVSELRKIRSGKAHVRVASWARSVDAADLYISVMTLQELDVGVMLLERRDAVQGEILRTWLEAQVIPAFEGRILPVTESVVRRSAKLQVPDPRPVVDSLIAATALVHRMAVVTRNIGDYSSTGVDLINPWDARAG